MAIHQNGIVKYALAKEETHTHMKFTRMYKFGGVGDDDDWQIMTNKLWKLKMGIDTQNCALWCHYRAIVMKNAMWVMGHVAT